MVAIEKAGSVSGGAVGGGVVGAVAEGAAAAIDVLGEFDLVASARFLEGFTPAARPDAAGDPGVLRFAFPVEDGWAHAGVLVRQSSPGSIEVRVEHGAETASAAIAQTCRILSVDVDGRGFAEVGRRDAVVAGLQQRYPGLRPVLFHSPYEAACWAVIGNRVRISQAAALKQRIAEQYGERISVGGHRLVSFPAPEVLRGLDRIPGLPERKLAYLRSVAGAAADGELDAATLRAMEPGRALDRLQRLPGIGPFSAQLILIRGAGHPDVFPANENRLHAEMVHAYGAAADSPAGAAELASRWAPFRSWAALLLRCDRERRTGEIVGDVGGGRGRGRG